MRIRECTIKDLTAKQLDFLRNNLTLGNSGLMYPDSYPAWVNKKDYPVAIAYIGTRPIGWCVLLFHESWNEKYVYNTFVRHDKRLQGIGTKLVKSVKRRATELDPKYISRREFYLKALA